PIIDSRLSPSPFFPYTTLFRSAELVVGRRPFLRHHDRDHRLPPRGVGATDARDLGDVRVVQQDALDVEGGDVLPAGLDDVLDPVDRKSTRLNSSHVSISYAVFC